jgi:hypothetical protein
MVTEHLFGDKPGRKKRMPPPAFSPKFNHAKQPVLKISKEELSLALYSSEDSCLKFINQYKETPVIMQ